MSDRFVERAPIAPEITEDAERVSAEVLRLDELRRKHAARRADKSDLPVFPVGPDAA